MKKQTILILSKDKVFADSIEFYLLEKRNYRIITVFDMPKALQVLRNYGVNLIMMDVKVPDLDSVQFGTQIFNQKICKPLIILNRNGTHQYWQKTEFMKGFGVVEYIDKPINLDRLDRSMSSALNRFQTNRSIISCINFISILFMIKMERKTGVLTVEADPAQGKLFFRGGDLLDVEAQGFSAQEFLLQTMQPDQDGMKIDMRYVEHKRKDNGAIEWSHMLPDNTFLNNLNRRQNQTEENKMAVNEKVFENLAEITGFVAGAIYYGDGELVTAKSLAGMDPAKMGGLAVELYKSATSIVNKMGLGTANFVQVHTDEYTFIHTCIIAGVAALGVIVKDGGNIGLMKHEMSSMATALKKDFSG